MFKSSEPTAPPAEVEARAIKREANARHRLGRMLLVSFSALVATMMVRGFALQFSTPEAARGDLVAAVTVGPVLIAIFWAGFSKRLRRCQAGARAKDPAVRERAITGALALPLVAARNYSIV